MKIEKLETSNNKFKYIVVGFILCAVIFILINYLTSKASYRNTESIDLAKGTINYKVPDLNTLAMYKDGEPTDTMPGAGYEIDTTQSYCYTTDPNQHENVTLATDSEGNLVIGNLKKGSKCFLYFIKPTAEQMIAKLEKAKGGNKYTITALTAPFGRDESESTNKLYSYPEGDETTYVFRGNVTDNWLRFGGKTWRIIRINSDGTLRVIFQCNTDNCTTTTLGLIIGESPYNTNHSDSTYEGYYYGIEGTSEYSQTHSNATPSTIATVVTNWYNSNLSQYTNKISGNTGFCNDRRISSESETTITYQPYERFNGKTSVTPDLSCEKNDLYTLKGNAGKGNGALDVPAALITMDEIALAGMLYSSNNAVKSNWLYATEQYWTMSPSIYSISYSFAGMFFMNSYVFISEDLVSYSNGVRPVINLKAGITISGGDGTSTNPFIAT